MLVLSRKHLESVVVGKADGLDRLLKVSVLGIHGTKVKLGFEVDPEVLVHRSEVWERLQDGGQRKRPQSSPRAMNQEWADGRMTVVDRPLRRRARDRASQHRIENPFPLLARTREEVQDLCGQ